MPATIFCPNPDCGASYNVVDQNLGRMGRCKKCGTKFPLVPHTRDGGESPPSTDPYSGHDVPETALPESFGRYQILRLLGRGGMGSVYLAMDTQLKRRVAIKVPHVTAFTDRPDVRVRFLREAEAAARFHHPNFCPIFDLGEIDGVPFLTMAYIDGKTLSASIGREQGWPPRRAAAVARQLASALAELHRQGIVHRDLKPANIMVDNRGGLVLMDFGLARWYDDAEGSTFTPAGAILGTPAYMSPEQAEGSTKAVGPRSDIYSLGVILYELLTGRRPYEGSLTKILGMIAFAEAPAPSTHRPDLDPELESICLKAMAKKPDDRYASMDDFAKALQKWLDIPGKDVEPVVKPAKADVGDLETIRDEEAPGRPDGNDAVRRLVRIMAVVLVVAMAGGLAAWLAWTSGTNSISMRFRTIPAGEFEMGSDDGDMDEKPKHTVRITKPFEIGTTEVTVGQFSRFVQETHYKTDAERSASGGFGWDEAKGAIVQDSKYTAWFTGFDQTDDHPVVNVSWGDATEFCAWLSRKEGKTYRLPTEAEWEYACRAGTTTRYSTGDDPEDLARVGNVSDATARQKFPTSEAIKASDGYLFTAPVGRFRPNARGLYDMHGNVWEWCADWYGSTYYWKLIPTVTDPQGPPEGPLTRVMRGGSWYVKPGNSLSEYRSTFRNFEAYTSPSIRVGFRVVRVP